MQVIRAPFSCTKRRCRMLSFRERLGLILTEQAGCGSSPEETPRISSTCTMTVICMVGWIPIPSFGVVVD